MRCGALFFSLEEKFQILAGWKGKLLRGKGGVRGGQDRLVRSSANRLGHDRCQTSCWQRTRYSLLFKGAPLLVGLR